MCNTVQYIMIENVNNLYKTVSHIDNIFTNIVVMLQIYKQTGVM